MPLYKFIQTINPRLYDNVEYDNYFYKRIADDIVRKFITSARLIPFFVYPSLTQIILPASVNSIENYAFKGCSLLTKIAIPSSVTSIGIYSFYECPSLEQLVIPSSLLIVLILKQKS